MAKRMLLMLAVTVVVVSGLGFRNTGKSSRPRTGSCSRLQKR